MTIRSPELEETALEFRHGEFPIGHRMCWVDAIRQVGVTEQTSYRSKKKYGETGAEQFQELKRLQKETGRLRRAVSGLTVDIRILSGPRGEPSEHRSPARVFRSGAQPDVGF